MLCVMRSLPFQSSGWHVIGVKASSARKCKRIRPVSSLSVSIGPFSDEPTCKGAITAQKSLTMQNTPLSDSNVFTSLTAKCHKLF